MIEILVNIIVVEILSLCIIYAMTASYAKILFQLFSIIISSIPNMELFETTN